jgi:hypothetical protein
MAGWLWEKSENSLKEVMELMKLLKGNISTKQRFKDNPLAPYETQKMTLQDEINEVLQALLFDMTKIYSFSVGSKWEVTDRDLILENLDDGLEQLQIKYGLLKKTKKQERQERYNEFIQKLNDLLNGEKVPNRTLLHELFRDNDKFIDEKTILGRILGSIEDELEKVTHGDQDWETFVTNANNLLKMF